MRVFALRRTALPVTLLFILAVVALISPQPAFAATPSIFHPVEVNDSTRWSDTYGAPRSGGRTHKGVDVMADQMTPVYAAEGGYIYRAYGADDRSCLDGAYCTSYGLLVFGDDGWSYFYLHFNDDTPGRPNGSCDHTGGAENAYSPKLVQTLRERGTLEPLPYRWRPETSVRVEKGELIGYVGSSGNAGCKVDHLHFEMWDGHDFKSSNDPSKSNPTPYVDAAFAEGRYATPMPFPVPTDRLQGQDRIGTALALATESFTTPTTVVVAPAWKYTESLLAAPLAGALDAPILLTPGEETAGGTRLDERVAQQMIDWGTTDVVIVSAADSLDGTLEAQIEEATGIDAANIRRIAAADQYDLSAAIASEMLQLRGWAPPAAESNAAGEPTLAETVAEATDPPADPTDPPADPTDPPAEPSDPPAEPSDPPAPVSVILALGEHEVESRAWPDALAATSLASKELVPILLTRGDGLPAATDTALRHEGFDEVRIVGGPAAISESVEAAINEEIGLPTRRLAGDTRYGTSLAVASELAAHADVTLARVHVATGLNFPDALASGPTLARSGGVLILIHGADQSRSPEIYQWLRDNAAAIESIRAIGGPAAVSDAVLTLAARYANY